MIHNREIDGNFPEMVASFVGYVTWVGTLTSATFTLLSLSVQKPKEPKSYFRRHFRGLFRHVTHIYRNMKMNATLQLQHGLIIMSFQVAILPGCGGELLLSVHAKMIP